MTSKKTHCDRLTHLCAEAYDLDGLLGTHRLTQERDEPKGFKVRLIGMCLINLLHNKNVLEMSHASALWLVITFA